MIMAMSFANVANTPDRKNAVDRLKQATEVVSYAKNSNQIFDNMNSDTQIPDSPTTDSPASRSQLIDILEAENSTDDTKNLELVHNFCYGHTQEGETDSVATTATLGRVHDVKTLAGHLHSQKHSGGTPNQILLRLRRLMRIRNPGNRLNLQKSEFGSDKLSKHQMWSCYDSRHLDDPFSGLGDSREATVVRLGLGYKPTDELVRWTHKLPSDIIPHRPTAWDSNVGEWSVLWRPTGKTHPTRSGLGGGFTEVVHNTTTAQNLVMAMEPLET